MSTEEDPLNKDDEWVPVLARQKSLRKLRKLAAAEMKALNSDRGGPSTLKDSAKGAAEHKDLGRGSSSTKRNVFQVLAADDEHTDGEIEEEEEVADPKPAPPPLKGRKCAGGCGSADDALAGLNGVFAEFAQLRGVQAFATVFRGWFQSQPSTTNTK